MTRRSRRQLKKPHRFWLHGDIVDASLRSHWRIRLFDSAPGEAFEISSADSTGLRPAAVAAIRKYKLRYCVRVAQAHEAEAWLSENGNVVFKFRAADFPTVATFSGNNPRVR